MGILDTGMSVAVAFTTVTNSTIPQKVVESSLLMIFLFDLHYAHKIKNVFGEVNRF